MANNRGQPRGRAGACRPVLFPLHSVRTKASPSTEVAIFPPKLHCLYRWTVHSPGVPGSGSHSGTHWLCGSQMLVVVRTHLKPLLTRPPAQLPHTASWWPGLQLPCRWFVSSARCRRASCSQNFRKICRPHGNTLFLILLGPAQDHSLHRRGNRGIEK